MRLKDQYYAEHSKFHVALDGIIFGFDKGELKLLIHKRQFEPAKGQWSLFGGFLKQEESLEEAANRILEELDRPGRHLYGRDPDLWEHWT